MFHGFAGVAVHAQLRGVRGQDQFDSETSVGPRICSPMAATTLSPPSSGKRTAICSAETASVTPSLPRSDLVGREDVLVRARPVGQQRARDGRLRLRVLRACRAVVSQQRVYL